MDVKMEIKVTTVSEALKVLDVLDSDNVKKNHPNVKVTIEVVTDAN